MSERPANQDPTLQSQAAIAERVGEQLGWLNQAAEIIGGPGARVEDVFDQPPQERRTAPAPDWTPEQEAGVREVAYRFGYGAEHNVPSGLPGGVLIAEGGLAWKIAAEAAAFDDEAGPRTLLFAGSPHRKLRDDEHTFLGERLGVKLGEDATEYDLARLFAQRQVGKTSGQEEVLHFGYELTEGNPTVQQPTGQLVFIGATSKGQSVQLLKVEGAPDPEDPTKILKDTKPDPVGLMRLMANVTALQGSKQEPIGLVTSNTYASRVVDAVRAGVSHSGRHFGVAMYGRRTLADMKGVEMQPDSPLNQLPGDLRETYDKLQDLAKILHPAEEAVDDSEVHPFDPQGHVDDTGTPPTRESFLNPPA